MTGCANCGHDSQRHSDGEYTGIGECFIKLNNEDKNLKKMEFCKCKEFVKKKIKKVKKDE